MSKLSTLDSPLERISGTDAPKENPYAIKVKNKNWDLLYPEGRNANAISRSDYSTNRNPLDA